MKYLAFVSSNNQFLEVQSLKKILGLNVDILCADCAKIISSISTKKYCGTRAPKSTLHRQLGIFFNVRKYIQVENKRESIRMIYFQDFGRLENIFIALAKKYGKSTIFIPDGEMNTENIRIETLLKYLIHSLIAVLLGIFIPRQRNFLDSKPSLALISPMQNNVNFDSEDSLVVQIESPRRFLLLKEISKGSPKHALLICGSPLHELGFVEIEEQTLISSFLNAGIELAEFHGIKKIYYRHHPGENSNRVLKNFHKIEISNESLAFDLQNCSYVLSYQSTVIFEALMANRAVFLYRNSSFKKSSTFDSLNVESTRIKDVYHCEFQNEHAPIYSISEYSQNLEKLFANDF